MHATNVVVIDFPAKGSAMGIFPGVLCNNYCNKKKMTIDDPMTCRCPSLPLFFTSELCLYKSRKDSTTSTFDPFASVLDTLTARGERMSRVSCVKNIGTKRGLSTCSLKKKVSQQPHSIMVSSCCKSILFFVGSMMEDSNRQ